VTNYEVDKTVRVTRNATGTIRRLSAAIVVNHRRSVDEAGKATLTALAPGELENIDALVREAIGFSKERGDSLNIVNAPFTEIEVPREVPLQPWEKPENIALARDLGKQAGLVLLALIVIFAVIRPALKAISRPPAPAGKLAARIDDPVQLPVPPAAQAAASLPRHEDILKIARDNPAAVANVVRTWVGTESRGA
jgi:flagellar M-ring protein FliF